MSAVRFAIVCSDQVNSAETLDGFTHDLGNNNP